MLRAIRIFGLLVFAFLVGTSGHALWRMYETGELQERYNSRRRANLTLLVFSVGAVGVLGVFELRSLGSKRERQRYGGQRYTDRKEEGTEGLDSTNIYAAPKTIDAWQGLRTRSSKRRPKPHTFDVSSFWVALLRVFCLILLLIYLTLLFLRVAKGTAGSLLVTIFFAVLAVIGLVATAGVFSRKIWGLVAGYILCIGNLVVFPLGTAAGLLLLMALVGAKPGFVAATRGYQKRGRFVSAL